MPVKPPIFRPAGPSSPVDSGKAYERERGTSRQRGYTAQWDKASKRYLAVHPLCLGCTAIGVVEPAVLTDHRMPHNGNQRLFWSEANWQPSCRWHHDVVKQRIEVMLGQGRAKAEDLALDSAMAMELSRTLMRGGGG